MRTDHLDLATLEPWRPLDIGGSYQPEPGTLVRFKERPTPAEHAGQVLDLDDERLGGVTDPDEPDPTWDLGCSTALFACTLVTVLAAGVGLRLWCDALWRTCPAVVGALAVGAVVAVAAWTAKRMGVRR